MASRYQIAKTMNHHWATSHCRWAVAPSRYRLRKAPQAGALSTIEAIVSALETLEAPAQFAALLRPFEALIEGQIAAMGEQTYQRNHLNPADR